MPLLICDNCLEVGCHRYLNKNELNFAVNGQYFSDGPIFSNIPDEVALSVSLWNVGNAVEILQYNKL